MTHLVIERFPVVGAPIAGSSHPEEGPVRMTADGFSQTRRGTPHSAQDIVASELTPVAAPFTMTAYSNGWSEYGGWYLLCNAHTANWDYTVYAAHFALQSRIAPGTLIQAGQLIGLVGRTGHSKRVGDIHAVPPHCHMQFKERPRGSKQPFVAVDIYEDLVALCKRKGHGTKLIPPAIEPDEAVALELAVQYAYGINVSLTTTAGPPAEDFHNTVPRQTTIIDLKERS